MYCFYKDLVLGLVKGVCDLLDQFSVGEPMQCQNSIVILSPLSAAAASVLPEIPAYTWGMFAWQIHRFDSNDSSTVPENQLLSFACESFRDNDNRQTAF